MIARIVSWLEVLGGSRPARFRTPVHSIALGVWWLALFLLTLAFAGRFTKFIYVDF